MQNTNDNQPENLSPIPDTLFYSTQIPVCLWLLAKTKPPTSNADVSALLKALTHSLREPLFANLQAQ